MSALPTVGFLRYRRRRADRVQPVTIAFAVLTTLSLVATYLLAVLSHRSPDLPTVDLVAGVVVLGLSSAITGVLAWAVLYSVWRTANASHPGRVRAAIERNS